MGIVGTALLVSRVGETCVWLPGRLGQARVWSAMPLRRAAQSEHLLVRCVLCEAWKKLIS